MTIEKRKQPKFTSHEAGQKPRIKKRWRAPKGHHNKMRLQVKGHKKPIKTGFGQPKAIRGYHTKTGLDIVMVKTIADLEKVDSKKQGIIVNDIGMRKKLVVLDEAKKKGITVINIKDVDAMKASFEAKRKESKEKRAANKKAQEAKKKEDEKASEQKGADKDAKSAQKSAPGKQAEAGDAATSSEDEEKAAKKEQEKILHHKKQ